MTLYCESSFGCFIPSDEATTDSLNQAVEIFRKRYLINGHDTEIDKRLEMLAPQYWLSLSHPVRFMIECRIDGAGPAGVVRVLVAAPDYGDDVTFNFFVCHRCVASLVSRGRRPLALAAACM